MMHGVYYSTKLASGYAPRARNLRIGRPTPCPSGEGGRCQLIRAGPGDFASSSVGAYMPTSAQIYALSRLPLPACDDRPIGGSPPAAHRFWPRRATCRPRRRAPCEPLRQFPASGPASCGSDRNVSNASPGGEGKRATSGRENGGRAQQKLDYLVSRALSLIRIRYSRAA